MRFDVVTAGDPAGAVVKAVREHGMTGPLHRISVERDAGCPCVTESRPITACTCEIVRVKRKPVKGTFSGDVVLYTDGGTS